MKRPARVGVFGGSFNPVHLGHLLAAREAKERLKLDELIFVPCGRSAYGKKLMPAALRMKALKAAIAGEKGYRASDLELKRSGASRTIDTMTALLADSPGTRFFLLIGADQVTRFPDWKEALVLSQLAAIVVLARPGVKPDPRIMRRYAMQPLAIPGCDISSSELRARLARKASIRWSMPPQSAAILLKA
ncbi:MAG: nicotinate (nicotinamide) nucleotide adenylyltransferase [candidate division FCPU426 bacterium]